MVDRQFTKRELQAQQTRVVGLLNYSIADYDRDFGQPKPPSNWPDVTPATRRGPALPDVWRIFNVPHTKWREDPCGLTVLINWMLPADTVRIDLMKDDKAIVSFQGNADDVRKHTMHWLALYVPAFGLDHAAYIGAELERADTERIDYVQDGGMMDTETETAAAIDKAITSQLEADTAFDAAIAEARARYTEAMEVDNL